TIAKAAAGVGKDRRVGTEQTKQFAEQQRRRNAHRSGERGMRDDRYAGIPRLRGERGNAGHHWRDEQHPHATASRVIKLLLYPIVSSAQVRRVHATAADLSIDIVD